MVRSASLQTRSPDKESITLVPVWDAGLPFLFVFLLSMSLLDLLDMLKMINII